MLVILVPLRNKSTSRDWAHVSRLCERSLRSYCAAGASLVRVVLIGRERPDMEFEHPALEFISQDFPDPGPVELDREKDKWRKLKLGLAHVRSAAPLHMMFADADDLLHRDVPAMVAAQPESPGWYFPTGYLYQEPNRWLYRWPDFDQYCGTSGIVRLTAADLPSNLDEPNEAFFILMYGHLVIREFMERRGTPLQPVPFPAAIYNTGNGENISGIALSQWGGKKMLLKKVLRARPLKPSLRHRFGLYPLPR